MSVENKCCGTDQWPGAMAEHLALFYFYPDIYIPQLQLHFSCKSRKRARIAYVHRAFQKGMNSYFSYTFSMFSQ